MEIRQSLKQSMNLVMTPQLQQAIRLLQLSRAELVEEIRRELESNPVLAEDDGQTGRLVRDAGSPTESDAASGMSERIDASDLGKRKEDAHVNDIDWDAFLENRTQQKVGEVRLGDGEAPPIEATYTRAETLEDHLRFQLQTSDFTESERDFAELVISNLDEKGFLDLRTSYDRSIDELVESIEGDLTAKLLVYNLGVFYENVGRFREAREAFQRFAGVDLDADEASEVEGLVATARQALRDALSVHAEVMRLSETKPPARDVLATIRETKTPDRPFYEAAIACVRDIGRVGDGACDRLEAALRSFDDLLARPGSALRTRTRNKAVELLRSGLLEAAIAHLARVAALDVEPHEKVRALGRIESLGDHRPRPSMRESNDAVTLEELAEQAGLDPEDAESVLADMQRWDPLGVCSRNLQECLRVQAEVLGFDELELAIIDRHMGNLEKQNYQAIARDLRIPLEDVYEAVKAIRELESRPARNFTNTDDKSIGITPDVFVIRDGEKWVVQDNDRGMPRFYLNEALVEQLRGTSKQSQNFIDDKVRNARYLLASLEKRRKTIVRVTEMIVELQGEFFDGGGSHLRPMTLKDVAIPLELHESTISRVTTNKWVHTPLGLFELKYFFNSSIRRETSEDIASESVKQAIKRLVDGEDKRKPYSDEDLVKKLREEGGIDIARRTVAKYREELRILSSTKRKKLF
jgi:RNA polymerase sigma-54 factor